MTATEQRLSTGVLVIGTGGSGLRAAIELAERGMDVLAVGKRPRADAHTALAAGGIEDLVRYGMPGVHPDIAGFQDLAHAFDLKSACWPRARPSRQRSSAGRLAARTTAPTTPHSTRRPELANRALDEDLAPVDEDDRAEDGVDPSGSGNLQWWVSEPPGEHVAQNHGGNGQQQADPETIPEHRDAVAGVLVVAGGVPRLVSADMLDWTHGHSRFGLCRMLLVNVGMVSHPLSMPRSTSEQGGERSQQSQVLDHHQKDHHCHHSSRQSHVRSHEVQDC
jgi:hypothetical protein